ncbi:MAG TPA: TetR family transcriptional regulator C-terminal domain-containing protein [Pseudonocardia sp.]|nr:TetR family transcriptional regulator C-terminal domain-containing protein [Pseudonocardia sp.]
MPKRVDHQQRRREIAAALVRCARARGLHAVGFREVAAEAGISVNLVQYYFSSKAELLAGGLAHLRERMGERLRDRLAGLPEPEDAAARVRAIVRELLPSDDTSTDLYTVHAAYAALALTDPGLAAQPHTAGPDELQPQLAALLARAAPGCDPEQTAVALLALGTGLAAYLATGYLTVEAATAALDAQLDRVLAR